MVAVELMCPCIVASAVIRERVRVSDGVGVLLLSLGRRGRGKEGMPVSMYALTD